MVRLSPAVLVALASLLAGIPAYAEPATDLAEIRTLRETGGHTVTARLGRLAESRSEDVRVAALEAIAGVGIRDRSTSRALDEAADRDKTAAEEAAFFRAIARVGGEHDVELLIDALKFHDQTLRELAHEALRGLTGRPFALEYGRWFQWWRKERPGLRATVRTALDRLPGANDADRASYRTTLARDGWVDHEHVSNTVSEWFSDGDRKLRGHGFHVIASLRLGGVASDAESALPHLSGIEGEDALGAVRALGLDASLLAPYWRERLGTRR